MFHNSESLAVGLRPRERDVLAEERLDERVDALQMLGKCAIVVDES